MRVVVLGSTGMLGSTVSRFLSQDNSLLVQVTDRDSMDAREATVDEIAETIDGNDWVINAVGIIKPWIKEGGYLSVQNAILVNSLFPSKLAEAAHKVNARVIQIATDCVYDGVKGSYVETDVHNALDVYGKTKSLGEVHADNFYNLRCSIIGPEHKAHLSLMDWFLRQPKYAEINGFTNHRWNGITTLQFAKICKGIIINKPPLDNIQHIVPSGYITKSDMLKTLAIEFNRRDIIISDIEAPNIIDRTLDTVTPFANEYLWRYAGYDTPPTVEEMIKELAEYTRQS